MGLPRFSGIIPPLFSINVLIWWNKFHPTQECGACGYALTSIPMIKLFELFSPQQRLLQQEREIRQLRQELQLQQAQNESMRSGMRRCVSCEYRIDYKNRQDRAMDDLS